MSLQLFWALAAMIRKPYLTGLVIRPTDTSCLNSIPDMASPVGYTLWPPAETPDGVRTQFTFPVVPKAILLSNVWRFENTHYVLSGQQITIPTNPSTGQPVFPDDGLRAIY